MLKNIVVICSLTTSMLIGSFSYADARSDLLKKIDSENANLKTLNAKHDLYVKAENLSYNVKIKDVEIIKHPSKDDRVAIKYVLWNDTSYPLLIAQPTFFLTTPSINDRQRSEVFENVAQQSQTDSIILLDNARFRHSDLGNITVTMKSEVSYIKFKLEDGVTYFVTDHVARNKSSNELFISQSQARLQSYYEELNAMNKP